ncbi:glycosyltransferase [Xylophilus rhododendri]|uniref:Glycosyltransferase n=1 Tax=Xylophilus rhododendri TaxID=2697032 RepID=A0A857J7M5_9BURK|nr:glycosyltransferase family 4 protein [Xylophilus rhododendri]QHI99974.1 glycosyltransferase [Xylophilus rhododendri]
MVKRILYLKGGTAVQEAKDLFPRKGELLDGGPDKFVLGVIHYLGDAEFRLATFGAENQAEQVMGYEAVEYALRPPHVHGWRRRWAFLKGMSRFFVETVRYKPTQILCGLDGPTGVVTWFAAKLCGARFVFLVHNALVLPSVSGIYRASNRLILKRSDLVLAHGPFLRQQALAGGAVANRVIEFQNGLDESHGALIDALRKEDAAEAAPQTLIYVGRVEEDKGVFDLLQAFELLAARYPVRLKFVGGGSAVAPLRECAASSPVADRVEVLGAVPFPEVFSHLKSSLVAVTPTQSRFPEGLCKTVLESYFVGVPVIGPDYGPFPYVIEDGVSGLLYKPDSVADLVKTIERYLDQPELRATLKDGAIAAGLRNKKPELGFHQAVRDVLLPAA